MFAIIGTVPDEDFPLVSGEVCLKDEQIHIQGSHFPINRGTPALLASAIKTCEATNQPLPYAFLVGDTGFGKGSRRLYEYLEKHLRQFAFHSMTFHYLLPDVDWHNRVLFAIEKMNPKPILIADAGFMYAAKMSGQAEQYDIFTPDAGELAFLADEKAPHPFYTRGFILHEEQRVPELIARAYQHKNASKILMVKGQKDYVVNQGNIISVIDSPAIPEMEPIGGTGDTLTGIISALTHSGMELTTVCMIAAQANRLAGYYAQPTPKTQVIEIISNIVKALREYNLPNPPAPFPERAGGVNRRLPPLRSGEGSGGGVLRKVSYQF